MTLKILKGQVYPALLKHALNNELNDQLKIIS